MSGVCGVSSEPKLCPAEEAGRERHPSFGSETLSASPGESGSTEKRGKGEKKKEKKR